MKLQMSTELNAIWGIDDMTTTNSSKANTLSKVMPTHTPSFDDSFVHAVVVKSNPTITGDGDLLPSPSSSKKSHTGKIDYVDMLISEDDVRAYDVIAGRGRAVRWSTWRPRFCYLFRLMTPKPVQFHSLI